MSPLLRKIFVRVIRPFLKKPFVRNKLSQISPKLITYSESINIRYKDKESNYLNILCDRNKISLDIGALWGGYTLLLLKFSKQVITFEPNESKYNHLLKVFNNAPSVTIKNQAVSNNDGYIKFRIPAGSPGNATIESRNPLSNFSTVDEYKVYAVSIDKLSLSNVGFIKIDIEGHELSALEGMKNLIEREKPILLIEVEERHNPGSIGRVYDFMKQLDYAAFFLFRNNLKSLSKFEVRKNQNEAKRNTPEYINNFIFIHESMANNILEKLSSHDVYIDEIER